MLLLTMVYYIYIYVALGSGFPRVSLASVGAISLVANIWALKNKKDGRLLSGTQ